jgi:hypothetical protein
MRQAEVRNQKNTRPIGINQQGGNRELGFGGRIVNAPMASQRTSKFSSIGAKVARENLPFGDEQIKFLSEFSRTEVSSRPAI